MTHHVSPPDTTGKLDSHGRSQSGTCRGVDTCAAWARMDRRRSHHRAALSALTGLRGRAAAPSQVSVAAGNPSGRHAAPLPDLSAALVGGEGHRKLCMEDMSGPEQTRQTRSGEKEQTTHTHSNPPHANLPQSQRPREAPASPSSEVGGREKASPQQPGKQLEPHPRQRQATGSLP